MKRTLLPAQEAEVVLGRRAVLDDRRHGRLVDGLRATSGVHAEGRRTVVHVITEEQWWRWALNGEVPTPRPVPARHLYVEDDVDA